MASVMLLLPFPGACSASVRCGTQKVFGHLAAATSRKSTTCCSFYRPVSGRRRRIHNNNCSSLLQRIPKSHYSTRRPDKDPSSSPSVMGSSLPESSRADSDNSQDTSSSSRSKTTTSMPTLKEVTAPSPESTSKPEEHRSSDPSVPNPPKNADDELPSLSESRRDRISAAIQTFMDNSQRVATETSSWASSATGTSYRAIERLKKQNADLETELAKSRDNLTVCRKEYQSIVSRRLQTQREVNTLLARKDGWTPQDLERFTSLYRDDHTLDASVNAASQALATAERETEQLRERLITGILGRYHEEQIWSDRIRRLSTWGTWGLMGVNVLLFFVFQFGAEPWRRRRLVHGFEEKVAEGVKKVLDEERERARAAGAAKTIPIAADVLVVDEKEGQAEAAAAEAVEEKDAVTEAPGVQVEDETATTPPTFPAPTATSLPEDTEPETWTQAWNRRKSFLLAPDRWKPALLDLASDRVVWLHMRDVSILVVEGIAAGAVMAGTLMIWVVGTGVARK